MKRTTTTVLGLLLVLVLIAALAWGSSQQNLPAYPTKGIEMVSAYASGGVSDRAARIVSEFAASELKKPVTVVNKAGGSGATGTVYVATAKPDGYTLLMHVIGAATLNPAIQKKLPYKYDDVMPIARTNINPVVFIVPPDSPYNSLNHLVEDVRKDPAKFSFSAGGVGSVSLFAVAQLMDSAGIDPAKLKMVVYDSGIAAATAVAGGHVNFAAQNTSDTLSLINGGKLKALAVTLTDRYTYLPEVPTTKEAGFEKVTMVGWCGVFGPKGLSTEVVNKWDALIKKALNDKDFVKKFKEAGYEPAYMDQKEFTKFIENEYNQSYKYAEQMGVRK